MDKIKEVCIKLEFRNDIISDTIVYTELFRKNKVLDELMRLVYGESWKSEKYVN